MGYVNEFYYSKDKWVFNTWVSAQIDWGEIVDKEYEDNADVDFEAPNGRSGYFKCDLYKLRK